MPRHTRYASPLATPHNATEHAGRVLGTTGRVVPTWSPSIATVVPMPITAAGRVEQSCIT